MEKLFARNGISLLQKEDDDGMVVNYAYTDALLARNVLIKFYTAVFSDSAEDVEEETAVFAITYDQTCFYSYILLVSGAEIGPLVVYRIIADAIDFIEHTAEESLLEDVKKIATGVIAHRNMEAPAQLTQLYDAEVEEFEAILKLINDNRPSK